jgi:type I restriction enzyme S subunit
MTTIEEKVLPAGWKWARFGDVAEYINGKAFKPEEWDTCGTPIIRIQNLNTPTAAHNYYSGDVEDKYQVCDGDLLISWSASLDAFIWDRGPAILNQHIFKVVERADVIRRDYLYYAAREAMTEIRSQVHGATMQHITKPEFENIRIPLPSLPEQKRIAAILTEQLAAVDRARAAAEAQLQAAKQLPAAFLSAVFDSTEAQDWPKTTIQHISSLVIDGPHITPTYEQAGIPFLTIRNIVNRHIDLSQVSYISHEDYRVFSRRGKIERGDILYTKDGTLGIPCVVDQDSDYGFFVSVALIKLRQESAYSRFVAYALESPDVLKQVELLGAGAGLKHMVLKSIRALQIPLPSLSIQKQVSAHLGDCFSEATRTQRAIQEQLDAINQMPATLLRQAFSGDI